MIDCIHVKFRFSWKVHLQSAFVTIWKVSTVIMQFRSIIQSLIKICEDFGVTYSNYQLITGSCQIVTLPTTKKKKLSATTNLNID